LHKSISYSERYLGDKKRKKDSEDKMEDFQEIKLDLSEIQGQVQPLPIMHFPVSAGTETWAIIYQSEQASNS